MISLILAVILSKRRLTFTICLCFFGVKAFVWGIVAENKKHLSGTPVDVNGTAMCQFQRDAFSVVLGCFSALSLVLATVAGHLAVFYPHTNSKSGAVTIPLPRRVLLRSPALIIFLAVTELVSALALAMTLWATIAQGVTGLLQDDNSTDKTVCPSKTNGLFGGGALLALNAALLWFVCYMLAAESRADYLHLHGYDHKDEGGDGKTVADDDEGGNGRTGVDDDEGGDGRIGLDHDAGDNGETGQYDEEEGDGKTGHGETGGEYSFAADA